MNSENQELPVQVREAVENSSSSNIKANNNNLETVKKGLTLRNRLFVLIIIGVMIVSSIGYWGIRGLGQIVDMSQASGVETLESERQLDKIKATLTDLHFVVTALRLSNKNDEYIINQNKLQGLSELFDKELSNYLAVHPPQPNGGGVDAPADELKRHTHVYNATLKIYTDSLRLGNYIAADRLMSASLSPEFLLINKSLDRLKNQELNAKAKNVNQLPALSAKIRLYGLVLVFLGTLIMISLPLFLFGKAVSFLQVLYNALDKLRFGEIGKEPLPEPPNEIGLIAQGINAVTRNLEQAANFANEVGRGKFDSEFQAAGDKDLLGAALVEMRDRLKAVADDEAKRSWAIAGFAKFGEILRKNVSLETFADEIIVNLTKYIDAIQGGFFVLQEYENQTSELVLISSYAYERKKYIDRSFRLGEGLVGEACRERATIFVTEVPQNYVTITSGLGQATPRCLLVVPLIANNELFGAIEFASFHKFEAHVIEFIEKMAENIASTLTNVRNNEKTVRLLQETQKITDQLRQSEEIARRNNEELSTAYAQVNQVQLELTGQINAMHNAAIVSESDLNGNIIFANDAFLRVAGYARKELIGKNHRLLKSGEHADEFYAQLWQTIAKGKIWNGEIKNRAKDGSYYWVQASITPVLDNENVPIKYISICFDISEPKRKDEQIREALEQSLRQEEQIRKALEQSVSQEEELRQNAEELEATHEEMNRIRMELDNRVNALNNSALVSETNVLGEIIFVNDQFCRVSQYANAELIGQNHRVLKSGHQPQYIFEDLWATISSGKVWRGEIKNRAKDGSYYWVASTITPILDVDAKPIRYIGVRFDITLQKAQAEQLQSSLEQAKSQEEEIRQNAEELETINEEMRRVQMELAGQINALNNSAIVSEADIFGNIIFINDEFCRVAKYSSDELIGQNHRLLKSGHQPQEIFDELWATISVGRVWRGIIKNKAKDGSYYWVASTITPILGADHKPLKYVGIRFEITAQKAQEQQLQQSLEEAKSQEEEIRQNAEELETINEEMRRVQIELAGQINALNNSAIVSEADIAGNIIFINDEFCRVAKYSSDELIGQNHRLLKSGHQPQEIFEELWATISVGKVWRGIIKNKAKDGSYYWVASTITPILGSDHKPLKYVGIRFEITAQKAQEEQLQQSLEEAKSQEEEIRQNAEELETINEEMRRVQIELTGQINALNNSAIVSEADIFGNIIFINEEFCRVAKYSSDELIGQNHRLLKSGHQPQAIFEELWATISIGKVWHGIIKNKAKDGSYYWVASTITPILGSDRKPIKYVGVRFDITDQKAQAEKLQQSLEEVRAQEEEIRQNAEELESINEEMRRVQIELTGQINALNNSAIVSEADISGNIIFVNEEFCRIAKYSSDELIGENHRVLKSGHQPQEIFEELWATISVGKVWRGTIKNKAKDGSYYWVVSTITPILGSDKKPIKYVGVRFDITDQKAQAEKIQQSLEELKAQEEEIRQNAEELETINEEMRRVQIELTGQINAINNSAIVSEADLAGNIIFINDEFCRVAKYSSDELIGQNHRLLKSGHQPQEIFEELWATISVGKVWRGIIKNKAKDGSYYWVASTITPILGSDKKPIKYVGVRFDITVQQEQATQIQAALEDARRQEAELRIYTQELQEAQNKMQAVQAELEYAAEELKASNLELDGQIEAINRSNAVLELDLSGNILKANQKFLDLSGYTLEEIIGKNERMFVTGNESNAIDYRLNWEKIRKEGAPSTELNRIGKDGKEFNILASYNLILGTDGKPVKILQIAVDISRIKLQEEALRQNALEIEMAAQEMSRLQIELKGQVNALNQAALVSEADILGNIIYVNDEFCRIAKYLRHELIGKNHRILKSGHQPQELFIELWATISRGKVWKGMIKNRAKDGTYYWVAATLSPVLDHNGKPIKYIGVRFEVTEQVLQSERLVELHDEMLRSTRSLQLQINAIKDLVGYFEINPQGIITTTNKVLLEKTGYNNYELLGAHYSIFIKAAENGFDAFITNSQIQTETCRDRLTILLKNGDQFASPAIIAAGANGMETRVLVYIN